MYEEKGRFEPDQSNTAVDQEIYSSARKIADKLIRLSEKHNLSTEQLFSLTIKVFCHSIKDTVE